MVAPAGVEPLQLLLSELSQIVSAGWHPSVILKRAPLHRFHSREIRGLATRLRRCSELQRMLRKSRTPTATRSRRIEAAGSAS